MAKVYDFKTREVVWEDKGVELKVIDSLNIALVIENFGMAIHKNTIPNDLGGIAVFSHMLYPDITIALPHGSFRFHAPATKRELNQFLKNLAARKVREMDLETQDVESAPFAVVSNIFISLYDERKYHKEVFLAARDRLVCELIHCFKITPAEAFEKLGLSPTEALFV